MSILLLLTVLQRYYEPERTSITCYNCQKTGHLASQCLEEKVRAFETAFYTHFDLLYSNRKLNLVFYVEKWGMREEIVLEICVIIVTHLGIYQRFVVYFL